MKTQLLTIIVLAVLSLSTNAVAQISTRGKNMEVKQLQSPQEPRLGFVIHGGAGTITRKSLTPELEAEYRAKLTEAVLAGYKALQDGKTSVDAVEIAVKIMEDSPLFNAGKGAVFNADGVNELDASIMDGKTLKAGAVAELHHIKNPISLARVVMEKSEHVFLVGDGAEKFARENKFEFVPQKYFYTESRWKALQRIKAEEKKKAEADKKG
ncbi:MAG: isoaspartyl peptidase/L-asparaginase, partial [Pyrinomonadaceae bacterium]|nr:isoaspartyl peptidase/L-asparaginase [Pyrinomonadaceae bacterium]